jgi:CRISPR-associated endonuclease/helicase Cas3
MGIGERFAEFFAAANDGSIPYPWQRELVELAARTGVWPGVCAPTGAGKSAVIEAHVFLNAECAAGRLAVRPPPRLVLVAPRRVLVDDQFERASRLARRLAGALGAEDGSALGEAAGALQRLHTSGSPHALPGGPLLVWSLRGGLLLDSGWRLEPAACQVICATPQMWGSRLLLRGYGASRASRNLEAGLLGHDVVAIIDEAHLHGRLLETARALAARSPGGLRLQVVAMSATQQAAPGQVGITSRDLADAELDRRVHARKEIELVEVADWGTELEAAIIQRARAAAGHGTVGVYVNDVPSALNVAAELAEGGRRAVELVCGRMRSADVARLRQRRPGLLTAVGDPEVEFLVSTQSLEVGVDLDLPAMVSAIAPASSLAQRAGRLNRSGRWGETTFAVVVPTTVAEAPSGGRRGIGPYEHEDLASAVEWLSSLDSSISPAAVAISEVPLPARPLLPTLRYVELETLALTSDVLSSDPDPDLYLQDPQDERPEVGVIARRYLGELDASVIRAALSACPPRQHELASLPWSPNPGPRSTLNRVLEVVRESAWVVRLDSGSLTVERASELGSLRPGDTLVVPHGAPICTAGVVGLGERAGRPGPLDDVLDRTPPGSAVDRIVALPAALVASVVADDPILGTRDGRRRVAEILDVGGNEQLARRLRGHRRLAELALTWCSGDLGVEIETGLLVVRDMRVRADEAPLVVPDSEVLVDQHQDAVAKRLESLIGALGLRDYDLPREELLVAARTHDEGKRHPRFQARMGAGDRALAKPRPGHKPDRGDGWRHEQLSAAYAAAACSRDALVISLVAAHHGRGRPLFDRQAEDLLDGWAECPPAVAEWVTRLFGPMGEYEHFRAEAQRRHGVHGLAWLEALLRCADMQVSREGG